MSKRCSKCGLEKSYSEFHKRSSAKDGYRSQCKTCRFAERPQSRLRSKLYYEKNTEKVLGANKHWQEAHKDIYNQYRYDWRNKHKEKASAHWAVSNAIRSGKLVKSPCLICGSLKVHAHHSDYSKRLDVLWLCNNHHKAIHKGEVHV